MNLKAPIHTLLRTFGFVIMLTLLPVGGFAAPADLDLSFGAGTVTTNFGPGGDGGESVAVQSNGKILVAGSSNKSGGGQTFALARYNSHGFLDKTFNGTGKVRTDFGFDWALGHGVAVQSDGKILVVGESSSLDITLVRYDANGTLDPSFNGTGKVTTDFGLWEVGNSVTVQSDGKILVAGSTINTFHYAYFAVARYNVNGSLDTTFNGSGKVETSFGPSPYAGANSITVQTDGKILVAGSASQGGFALARYNPDGTLDLTFNGSGKVQTVVSSADDQGRSVRVQADGKILVAGIAYNSTTGDSEFALVRYNSDGSLDLSFNGTGMATADFGSSSGDYGESLAVQTDGKIVVAGASRKSFTSNFSFAFALVRFNRNGGLDATLNGSGKLTTPVGSGASVGSSVVLTNGKIIVAGTALNGSNADFALASYNSDGTLDKTFHAIGRVRTAVGPFGQVGDSVAVAADGKIVVAGSSVQRARRILNSDFAVVRYNADGRRDTTFNLTGKVTTELSPDDDYGQSVAVLANGKILVAGTSFNSSNNQDFALVRYNANGHLDTTFQGTGKVTTDFDAGDDDGRSLALQTDGKILVAGSAEVGSRNFFALVRYNNNGSLDLTFNGTGKVTTAIGSINSSGRSVAVQMDGKILVAGFASIGGANDIALARYNTDGSLDTTFHGDGKVTTAIGVNDDWAESLKVQSDGKIVVAGYSFNGSNYDIALVRYKTNGALDTTFNGTGKITTAVGSGDDFGSSVTLQTNGKIIVAGSSVTATGDGVDIAVLRYNSNGTLDDTFNGTGIRTTAFRMVANGNSVTLQPDGKIVVAGSSRLSNGESDFAVVRYMGGM